MADVELIEEASELGISIADQKIIEEELKLLEQKLITTGTVFKLKLNDLILGLETRGLSPEQVINVLLDDFDNDGPIFGGLKRGLIGNSQGEINVISQRLDSEGFSEFEELQTWVAVLVNTCVDCLPRHGVTRTKQEWINLGEPASGFSVCGPNCDCQLFPASIAESKEELQAPLKRTKKKITQIAKEKKKKGQIKSVPNYVNRKLGSVHNTQDPIRKEYRKLLPGFKR